MAEGQDHLELKFRLFDGSDIGPNTYIPSTTIAALKERILAEWPQDKKTVPKSVNDVKLIYSGKVLENTKTLAESRIPLGELPGGVITMHVVVQPSVARKKAGDLPKNGLDLINVCHIGTEPPVTLNEIGNANSYGMAESQLSLLC